MAKRSRSRTPWILGALIVFIAADLALVGFALRGPSTDSGSVNAIVPSTGTPVPTTAAPVAPATVAPTDSPTGAASTAPATEAPVTSTTPATAGSTAPATSTPSSTGAASALSGMASETVGYRSTPGSCVGTSTSTDAVIELTTDGGKTWSNVNPTNIRIRAVEQMIVVDETHVDLLAKYGDTCAESDVTTYTQGEFWQVYPDRTAQFE